MEKWVTPPENLVELVFGQPWPIRWAYSLLVIAIVLSVFAWRRNGGVPRILAFLPACWVVWQLAASAHTVDSALSFATVPHLAAATACFYLGALVLGKSENPRHFWIGLLVGMSLVIVSGWNQRFGGLEETRKYFWESIYPTLKTVPEDYIKKISSNRIFSTLFYPNTLAAALILLLPGLTAVVFRWAGGGRFTMPARLFLTSILAVSGLACLFWSGSKGGWLVMMLVIVLGFLTWPLHTAVKSGPNQEKFLRLAHRARLFVVVVLVVGGLAGFFWTYASFFKRGAPSVGARFDYWRAAVQNAIANPLFGSGPGTFARPYSELKASKSEMSRLVHNDYLQQASDSGLPGFFFYVSFIVCALYFARKSTFSVLHSSQSVEDRVLRFGIWLGICGWAIHSLLEFNLYVPAIAWTAFALLGWLCGRDSAPDKVRAATG